MATNETPRLIPLMDAPREFARWLPRRRKGQTPSASWFARAAKHGTHGVRMHTTYVGGCQCVTEEDVRRYFAEVTEARRGAPAPKPADTSAQHAQAEQELAAVGI